MSKVEFDQNTQNTNITAEEESEEACDNAWTFDDVVSALRFIAVPTNIPITGFSIDSRTIIPGQAFIALKGERVDGHDFVSQAYERGAAMAIVQDPDLPSLSARSYLCVPNTKTALMDLAQYARARTCATVVGVSGSVGKTTVRTWIAELLSSAGDTVSTQRNFNGQIGLPLSMTQLGPQTNFGIFEIGIDAPDTMQALTTLCNPHVAVLTPVTHAHMENFESIDSLAYEKAMLFSGLCPNGVVVVDKESCQAFPIIPHLAKEFGAIDVITVGKDADVQIVNSKVCNNATHVTVEAGGVTFEYAIQSVGAHFVLDSAIAFASAMCAAFDGTLKNIVHEHGEEIKNVFCPVMNNLKPIAGRGQTYMLALDDKREITVIDDAYNANLTSMLSGLRSFECASGKRRVAVIGDMLALGEMTTRAHEQLFEALAHSNIDKIYAVGMLVRPHFAKIPAHKQGRLASSREELEAILFHELQHGDVVWVKASNAVGLYGLFGDLTERVQADIAA